MWGECFNGEVSVFWLTTGQVTGLYVSEPDISSDFRFDAGLRQEL